jgi:membrane-bound ClpP family serine protease
MEEFSEHKMTRTTTGSFLPEDNSFGQNYHIYMRYLVHILISIKILIMFLMVFFCFSIIRTLRKRKQKIGVMMSSQQAANKLQEMSDLCKFQYVDTFFYDY